MPFAAITRDTLEILNQNYRLPGVMPRPVPPARGNAASPQDESYSVVDELIQVIPFINVANVDRRPYARQYQVRTINNVFEPPFTARGSSTVWVPGASSGGGEELEIVGTRFKKISTLVRTDELMVSEEYDEDVFQVQIKLAEIGIVRSLSEALFFSNPGSDDDAEFSGLQFYLPAGSPNDVSYDSARGMIGGLAELEARTAPSDGNYGGGPDVFVMSSRARWRLLKELEDKGITPDFMHCPWTGRVQFHFHGTPVLTGRVPEPGGTATSEAWALRLVGPTGVRVLHVDGDSGRYGLRHETITTVTGLDANGEAQSASRGVEVFGVFSLIVPEPNSIARLDGIPIEAPFTI